jgi:hypothetical protein
MKQYTKHALILNKQYRKVILVATITAAQESSKSELWLESYGVLRLELN